MEARRAACHRIFAQCPMISDMGMPFRRAIPYQSGRSFAASANSPKKCPDELSHCNRQEKKARNHRIPGGWSRATRSTCNGSETILPDSERHLRAPRPSGFWPAACVPNSLTARPANGPTGKPANSLHSANARSSQAQCRDIRIQERSGSAPRAGSRARVPQLSRWSAPGQTFRGTCMMPCCEAGSWINSRTDHFGRGTPSRRAVRAHCIPKVVVEGRPAL